MATAQQHYFITGVSSGIGKALAQQLCEAGHKVSGVARRKAQLDELAATYDSFTGYECDVTDEAVMNQAVGQAIDHHGPIDVVIPNAGIYQPQPAGHIEPDAFLHHMNVNYFAVIHCLAAILPQMQARNQGHIALMASVAGYRGLPRSAAYGPTKAALINFAESLRFDLSDTNIKLQVINPGFVETEATAVNDFDMPDLITAETAASEIIAGLKTDQFEISFPKSFVRKMKWLKLMPDKLYFTVVKKMTKA